MGSAGLARGAAALGSSREAGSSGEAACSGWGTACSLVDLGHDGVEHSFEFLLLGLEGAGLGIGIGAHPPLDFLDFSLDGVLVAGGDLVLQLLVVKGVLDADAVALKSVLGFNSLSDLLVLVLELLGLLDELLDFVLGKTTLVVGDGDLLRLRGALVGGIDAHDTVLVDFEGDLNLGHSSRGWGDAVQVELAQQVVVLGHLSLTLKHLDQHTGLVVGVGGEGLRLLGWDGGVPGNQHSHNTSCSLDTE